MPVDNGNAATEGQSAGDVFERLVSDAAKAVVAAPFGFVVLVAAIVLAFWSNHRVDYLYARAVSDDARHALEALRIGSIALWVTIALFGRQIMLTARRHQELMRRQDEFATDLQLLAARVSKESGKAQEQAKKSRSFWDRLRNEPKL